MARPTTYTQELAEKFCHAIATTRKSKRLICQEQDLPYSTITHWLSPVNPSYIPEFRAMYIMAKEWQADALVAEIFDIADKATPESIAICKLQIDVRKWAAGNLAPRNWGNRLTAPVAGEDTEEVKEKTVQLFRIGGVEFEL